MGANSDFNNGQTVDTNYNSKYMRREVSCWCRLPARTAPPSVPLAQLPFVILPRH